jgi:hypothetical protein
MGDQARTQFRIECSDQGASIGLVQIADQFAQGRGICSGNRLRDTFDIFFVDCPVVPTQCHGGNRRGRVCRLDHAEPCLRMSPDSRRLYAAAPTLANR